MALSDNLVAAWELDEASGNAIDSHGSNDLTETGGTIGTGTGIIYGTARDFERDDTEYFAIADNADVSMGDIDFTFEAWVKLETVGARQMVVTKDVSGNREYIFGFNDDGTDRFAWTVLDGSGFTQVVATNFGTISTGTWYQVFVWHDSVNNQIGIAVNTTANTMAHSTGVFNGTAAFHIGSRAFVGAEDNLDGLIGPVRLWKRVLTSSERTELYNSGAGRTYSYIVSGAGGTGFRSRIAGGFVVAA